MASSSSIDAGNDSVPLSNWSWLMTAGTIHNMAEAHDSTGFWGPVEANHAFCEPHYVVSPYIAEFFNSTSSIVYILLALLLRFPGDKTLKCAQVWLAAVGVGSMLFHGTMRYVFQLADEIPMVGFLSTLMVAKVSIPHPYIAQQKNAASLSRFANMLIALYGTTLISVYVVMNQYEIFIHGFTIMVLADTILTLTCMDTTSKLQRRAYALSFFGIVLGRIAWEIESSVCPQHSSVWPLHVVWHVLSCLSAYGAMVNAYAMRADKRRHQGAAAKTSTRFPRFVGFDDCIAIADTERSKED